MKKQIQKLLAALAQRIIAKYHPKIIGITGSVGKTSAKEAIYAVVANRYRAYRPLKNFNNEFGLPFAIIGVDAPGRSVGKWLGIFSKALSLIMFNHKYPEVLILEYGIDRAGDMDYLVSIATPDIAVITSIGASHYEFFMDIAAIEQEKGKLVESLSDRGTAVLNADNEIVLRQRNKTKAQVVTYGTHSTNADIVLKNIEEDFEGQKIMTRFTVTVPSNESFTGWITALGHTHVSAAAAAVAIGVTLHIDHKTIVQGLQNYKPAPSRLNAIPGVKRSVLIDDTYNASPDSMREALVVLGRFPRPHKMAVLGDMLELGGLSDEAHLQVGEAVAALAIDQLITVGPSGKLIADAALHAGMLEDKILSFDNSEDAKRAVQQILRPESVVLIKGSQGMRMEKITVEIMAEPMRAAELICRQNNTWLKH